MCEQGPDPLKFEELEARRKALTAVFPFPRSSEPSEATTRPLQGQQRQDAGEPVVGVSYNHRITSLENQVRQLQKQIEELQGLLEQLRSFIGQ